MLRHSLPAVLALMFAAPLVAAEGEVPTVPASAPSQLPAAPVTAATPAATAAAPTATAPSTAVSTPVPPAVESSVPVPAGGAQALFSFVRPTDTVKITPQGADLPQANAEQTAEGEVLRRVTFSASDKPALRLAPPTGVWDWRQNSALTLRMQSAMDWALTLYVTVQSTDGKTLTSRIDLPAGPAQTVIVPLQASSPASQGMRAGPPMPWTQDGQRVLLASSGGDLSRDQVASVTLSLDKPNVAQSILIERVALLSGDTLQKAAYSQIVDAYGQFTRSRWPEKVSCDDQLKTEAGREQQQLKGWLAERNKSGIDRFGGVTGGVSFEATGFFRTQKHEGRWYLVTPEGHPFYSLGVNAVIADNERTYVEGREWMFSSLPKADEPAAAFYGQRDDRSGNGSAEGVGYNHGRWFDFYAANLQRTYGKPGGPTAFDAARWQAHTLDRLQGWGFNTIGNWSAAGLESAERVPYTLPLSIVGDYASISTGMDWWGRMPDPFDPRFAMATERAVAIAARDHREDPWLIGYYADNELAWAGPGATPETRYALALGTLKLTTDIPAKRAFLKQLRDKYRNQEGLAKAWGIELPAWELMEDPGFQGPLPNPEYPQIEADYQHFQESFADTYFKTVSDALKWHAPNQLLLGGRFAVSTPEAVKACAQYCDVLSFNFYTPTPQDGYDFKALAALDKPVLVSEFHFGSRDRGLFWPGVMEVAREEDRGPAYDKFLDAALKEPSIVGVHWFQYLDEPLTGRLLDGENGHFGLVAITDLPYAGFVASVRKSNLAALDRLRKLAPAAPAQEHGGKGGAQGPGHAGKGAAH
jgi:hypothetical protein